MRRPPSSAFVLGHPTTRMLTIGAAIVSCFAWAGHAVSWLAPALALLLCKASFAARKRVARYQEWRTAWDEMQEPEVRRQERSPAPAPEPKAIATAIPRTEPPPAKRPVLISAWLVTLGWLAAHDQQANGYPAVALAFLALSAWGACVVLLRLARWLLGWAASPARASTSRHAAPGVPADDPRIVAQSLPVPPPVKRTGHVRERLPQYCRDLLARSAAASTNDRT
jgi:hypothetical protein